MAYREVGKDSEGGGKEATQRKAVARGGGGVERNVGYPLILEICGSFRLSSE